MAETKEQSSPQSSPRTKLGNNNSSMSNNASSIHEDENLISHKGLIKTPSTVQESKFKPVTSPKEDRPKKYSLQHEGPLIFKPSLREKLSALLKSKTAEITITGLIAIYMILVFLNIMMETGVEEDVNLVRAIKGLKFAELGILALLIIEVILKVAVFGIKGYFRNIWSIIDCMLLFVTFGMVIADIEVEDSTFNGVNRVRALFRLFRVFLIIRKANDISRINIARVGTSNLAFKSPVEKVLELFETFKRCTSDKSLIQEIDWAIETVSSNKLYEPIIDEGKDGKNEVGLWVKSYQTKDKVDPKKISQELARRPSTMPPAGITPSSKGTNIVLPFEAREMLTKNVDLLNFDVMAFKEISTGQELSYTAMFLFERHNFFDALNIKQQTFFKFIRKVQAGYLPNPYHNSTHAADVLQSTNYFLTTGEFISKAQLTNLEVCSLFIGSAIHDYDHPGTNNAFHINTSSPYAIRYNDRGVLENHHVSSVFELMKKEEFNIFEDFSKEDYKIIRERIIAIVLATDMSTHFGDVAKLKGRLAADFDIKDKDKKFIMEMIVHAADISNPSKPWDTCREWTTRIVTEFFNQGDKERDIGLPITYLCDRYTVNTAKSQIGFIDFVVSPLFTLMKEVLPKVDISHLEINKNKWKDLVEFYEQELKAVNERRKTTTEAKEIAA